MFTGLLPAGGLSESAVIRYLYIFNKKQHHKKIPHSQGDAG